MRALHRFSRDQRAIVVVSGIRPGAVLESGRSLPIVLDEFALNSYSPRIWEELSTQYINGVVCLIKVPV